MLLLALLVAAVLRFWQLGEAPPGFYRDEAQNGLDALGVLRGNHAVYFAANNGREPSYIYLTALSIGLVGRTVFAVRLAAAVAGTLTAFVVYLLGKSWFGQRVALFATWLWAVTLWPVHLSRIGLRAVLLAPFLALAFWLGTLAYRRQRAWLWAAAGVAYGAAFYTYLAVRFTPVLLLLLISYLLLKQRGMQLGGLSDRRALLSRLWPGTFWFLLGALLTTTPLILAAWQAPDLILGRVGQVSIFNPAVGGPNLPLTFLRQTGRALGMFLWRGDDILRHNPAGRPVFDLLMAVPFLIGLIWCLRHWRNPPAAAVLLWMAVMLGPTILAEDAPHFLRASGVLPVVLFMPALGLSKLWEWPKLADALRRGLVLLLVLGTLIVTIADYVDYMRQPDTAYLFEAAARELAQQINVEPPGVDVFVDRRFWEGWPSLSFLLPETTAVTWFAPQTELDRRPELPAAIYAWPHEGLDFVPASLDSPVLISIDEGSLARGDLEPAPYPLYVRYSADAYRPPAATIIFGEGIALHDASAQVVEADGQNATRLEVELYWSAVQENLVQNALAVFVHVIGSGRLIGQSDAPLAQGYWPLASWRAGQVVRQQHTIELQEPFDLTHHQIVVGLYDVVTTVRLPARTPQGEPIGDSWLLSREP